ncbi:Hypothetical predicted protein [Xyrichtys novacula]|uniref:Uncharacterized protein n=1 Tax=Xyrichtys novacula TaxID=13765 RepID=A0AAV1FS99_XYRNO|nr:Hypothetical predicted protein [Xyrichtys novacula]
MLMLKEVMSQKVILILHVPPPFAGSDFVQSQSRRVVVMATSSPPPSSPYTPPLSSSSSPYWTDFMCRIDAVGHFTRRRVFGAVRDDVTVMSRPGFCFFGATSGDISTPTHLNMNSSAINQSRSASASAPQSYPHCCRR